MPNKEEETQDNKIVVDNGNGAETKDVHDVNNDGDSTETVDSENNKELDSQVDETQQKTFTAEQLNAILERKTGKKDKTVQELEEQLAIARKNEEEARKAAEEKYLAGLEEGKIKERKDLVAKTYGLDVDIIPDDLEKIEKFETAIKNYAEGRTRVIPMQSKEEPKSSWIMGVQ